MTPLYPLFLKLEGERALVVGAGRLAAEKAKELLACGARVVFVAPEIDVGVRALAGEHAQDVTVHARAFVDDDVDGARIVIAATDDTETNTRVHAAAVRAGALVNVVDVPPLCTFYTGGVVRRGPLTVVVGTSGASPSLARRVRLLLEEQLSPALAPLARALGAARPALLARYPEFKTRAAVLDAFVAEAIDTLDDDATDDEVAARVAFALLSDGEA